MQGLGESCENLKDLCCILCDRKRWMVTDFVHFFGQVLSGPFPLCLLQLVAAAATASAALEPRDRALLQLLLLLFRSFDAACQSPGDTLADCFGDPSTVAHAPAAASSASPEAASAAAHEQQLVPC